MTTKLSAAVQLGRLGGKARAARMSKTELSEAGRNAASAPRGQMVSVTKATAAFAAYVFDRACQYEQSSGIAAALYEVAARIRQGDAWGAFSRGELDDVVVRFTPRPSRRKAKVGT